MKLRYSPTSPFVRKVMVAAIELGIEDSIQTVAANVWGGGGGIAEDNPLGKVPALITEGGETLYDSPVICEFLNSLCEGPGLIPVSGGARWIALRRQALADGVIDAGALRLLEGRRPESEQSPSWIERQKAVVERGMDALEAEADSGMLNGEATIGHVAIGVTLGWFDFRYSHEPWRTGRPALAEWFETFCQRPSMTKTEPKE
ncbi:MAG TPA: glutathione S-transferase [Rhodospirillales bacterium]|nr:glutathione S-transferase [Rhodospirillales bacterium]